MNARVSRLLLLTTLATSTIGCASSEMDPIFHEAGVGDFELLPDAARCLPNNDGVIERSELSFITGVPVNYRINPPDTVVDVNVAGELNEGKLLWDFSSLANSSVISVALREVGSQWFAADFPNASYAVPADATGDLLQILQLDNDRLLLLGLASREPDKTRLVYDTPIVFFRFPLRVGDKHVSEGNASGKLDGLDIATQDRYEVEVDAEGTVRLAAVDLSHSLRVRVTLTSKALGGLSVTTQQIQLFHECYGEVVRAVSLPDELERDFRKATELRRLSF